MTSQEFFRLLIITCKSTYNINISDICCNTLEIWSNYYKKLLYHTYMTKCFIALYGQYKNKSYFPVNSNNPFIIKYLTTDGNENVKILTIHIQLIDSFKILYHLCSTILLR